MHALANPTRFLRIARPVTTWLLLIGLVLAVGGMAAGLILTPPDYLQGETVRILYIHVPAAWLAWVPILQIWTFFSSAGKSLLWIIPCLIPFVNVFVGVYLWMCIAENLGKNKWLGLLTLVPVVNLILPAILAFSKKEGTATPRPAVA